MSIYDLLHDNPSLTISINGGQLIEIVEKSIDNVLGKYLDTKPEVTPDKWMDISELREYHPDHPKTATIYSWVSSKEIPNHKNGKKLRFLKSEIDQWLTTGKRKSESELQIEAENYQSKKGGVHRHE